MSTGQKYMNISKPNPKLRWWHNNFGYIVYVRSFKDTSGDGFGDLTGVLEELDYLKWLGIDSIWITPFYPTPDFDNGYDIIDYYQIDERFGDFAALELLIEEAHKRNIKIICDIVPNHTSHKHEWFQQALADPTSKYRDYYMFRDPKPDGGLPNNWLSHFGGPAWTFDEKSGQYYLHLFLKEQPDLNWRNPAVQNEFKEIVEFWVQKGVDGFRIDVSHLCYKDEKLRDQPWFAEEDELEKANVRELFELMDQKYALCQAETPSIFKEWKNIAHSINDNFLLFGEWGETNLLPAKDYVVDGCLDMLLYTQPHQIDWDFKKVLSLLEESSNGFDQKIIWTLDTTEHDRSVTRLGSQRRAKCLQTLFAFLPGFPHIYMGQELGLKSSVIAKEDVKDCISLNDMANFEIGRDKVRTHYPHNMDGKWNGFSESKNIWLNSETKKEFETKEHQREDPKSYMHFMRRLIEARKSLKYTGNEQIEVKILSDDVLEVGLGGVILVCNMSGDDLKLEGKKDLVFSSGDDLHSIGGMSTSVFIIK
jgi:alpha-glucosidase